MTRLRPSADPNPSPTLRLQLPHFRLEQVSAQGLDGLGRSGSGGKDICPHKAHGRPKVTDHLLKFPKGYWTGPAGAAFPALTVPSRSIVP